MVFGAGPGGRGDNLLSPARAGAAEHLLRLDLGHQGGRGGSEGPLMARRGWGLQPSPAQGLRELVSWCPAGDGTRCWSHRAGGLLWRWPGHQNRAQDGPGLAGSSNLRPVCGVFKPGFAGSWMGSQPGSGLSGSGGKPVAQKPWCRDAPRPLHPG